MGGKTPGILVANGPDTIFQGGNVLRPFPEPNGKAQGKEPPPAFKIRGLKQCPVPGGIKEFVKAPGQRGNFLPQKPVPFFRDTLAYPRKKGGLPDIIFVPAPE
jgi:hypothetical protein